MRWLALWLALALPAHAVDPTEILDDPDLEARAREISKELRCVVCRNESIDESNATIAGDMRRLVRERLVAGDSDETVIQALVDRYGEYVLLRPTFSAKNLAIWLGGPVLLILGGLIAAWTIRGQRTSGTVPLSDEEQRRLSELLKDP